MTFKYIVDPTIEYDPDYREINRRYGEYLQYIESIKDALPKSAYEFAKASWHYDIRDHHVLHDSWVETFTIREVHPKEDFHDRDLQIDVWLLGTQFDLYTLLHYEGVKSYEFVKPSNFSSLQKKTCHSDWLTDEVRLTEKNTIIHEVVFASSARWIIECTDIHWSWEPIESPKEP